MKVLVINCGSSSLKYQLFDMNQKSVMVKGLVERIGIEGSVCKHDKPGSEKVIIEKPMEDHTKALEIVLDAIADPKIGAIASMDEITAVGHRVVHGGEKFANSVLIDNEVLKAIEECNDLAPLHNPANIMGIEACRRILPNTPMVAVFDTAFHQTIPAENFIYPLPYKFYEEYGIRRYGFHGTSHKYVAERAASLLGKDINELNIITCHLGNGASITAIKGGKSFDTSMGFTPLAGLAMGTRTGDIDPAITTYLMHKENLTIEDIDRIYNKESGILGVSGVSSDFRDVEAAAHAGNERAQLALDVFYHRVKFYIGAYFALLGTVDAVVFTAGLGENSPVTREAVCDHLDTLHIAIDPSLNANARGKEIEITTKESSTKVFVIPTNEELMIARETLALI